MYVDARVEFLQGLRKMALAAEQRDVLDWTSFCHEWSTWMGSQYGSASGSECINAVKTIVAEISKKPVTSRGHLERWHASQLKKMPKPDVVFNF